MMLIEFLLAEVLGIYVALEKAHEVCSANISLMSVGEEGKWRFVLRWDSEEPSRDKLWDVGVITGE